MSDGIEVELDSRYPGKEVMQSRQDLEEARHSKSHPHRFVTKKDELSMVIRAGSWMIG